MKPRIYPFLPLLICLLTACWTPEQHISTEATHNSPSDKWLSNLKTSLLQQEYHIFFNEKEGKHQSPNRIHNLRSSFSAGVIQLQNRIDSARHDWQFKLTTLGIESDGKLYQTPVQQPKTSVNKDTIAFHHESYTEEYINNEAGLRQNFYIHDAPSGTQEIKVNMMASGLKINQVSRNELHFFRETGRDHVEKILTYNDLNVWDTNNQPLYAHFETNGEEFAISVDVRDASYPITIDPIISNGEPGNANATLEFNQANAAFGISVASAGDVNGDGYSDVIIGAYNYDQTHTDEGAIFVYHGSATGLASLPSDIAYGGQAGAQFGYSVSTAGDVNGDGFSDIIVGANQYDFIYSNIGAAYVFHGSSSGLNGSPTTIYSAQIQADAKFGQSVACAGDVDGDGYSDVIIGSPVHDFGQTNNGLVFIHHGSASGVNTTHDASLHVNSANAQMGYSVASAGDVNRDGYSDVIVGAPFFSDGQLFEGKAFIYHGSGSGINTTIAASIESNQNFANLGNAVSTAGDVNGDGYSDIIIGAYQYDLGQTDEGVVFIHHGSASGINSSPDQTLQKDQPGANIGFSVATAGDVNGDGYADVIVGAIRFDKGEVDEGAAFVYHGSVSGIKSTSSSILESNQGFANMGNIVAPAGDVNGDGFSDVIVGAWKYDNGQTDEGSVFVFHGGSSGTNEPHAILLEKNVGAQLFGWAVASAGDVNGDGYCDLLVSTHAYHNGQSQEGGVFVYHGSENGISSSSQITLEGNVVGARMGRTAASAGDINGDGYADIVMGAPHYTNGESKEGAAYVYYGSSSGINASSLDILESNQVDAIMGTSVASAGDVNGDGFSDVIVGVPGYENGQSNEGAAYVYYGSAGGLVTSSPVILEKDKHSAKMGTSVASAGDVNGDGFSDVIIGAPYGTSGEYQEGLAFLYLGSPGGIATTSSATLQIDEESAKFGISVASAGDVNGDGYSDVVIGGPESNALVYPDGATFVLGGVYLYHGSSSGLSTSPSTELKGPILNLGMQVASAGDVNSDGYSDIIVGVRDYMNTIGIAHVYHGSSQGIKSEIKHKIIGKSNGQVGANSNLGMSVGSAGDVNGDGYSDIVIGAPLYTNGQAFEGVALVYHGNAGGGTRRNLQLFNTSSLTPIDQSNVSAPGFRVGLWARNILGRTKAKLVWETKAEGQPFSGAGNLGQSTSSTGQSTNYQDLGQTGKRLLSNVAKMGIRTKVRARIKYDPTTAINGQVYGPWVYMQVGQLPPLQQNSFPIELLEFTAEPTDDQQVVLSWATASETNNAFFTIERSIDARIFEAILDVPSQGSGTELRTYEIFDSEPQMGKSYYRLKQTDLDGSFSYSDVKEVILEPQKALPFLYPSPVSKHQSITLDMADYERLTLVIIDMQGREVFRHKMEGQGSNPVFSTGISADGPYVYQLLYQGNRVASGRLWIRD